MRNNAPEIAMNPENGRGTPVRHDFSRKSAWSRWLALGAMALLMAGGVQAEIFDQAPLRNIGPSSNVQVGRSIGGQGGWTMSCSPTSYDEEITHVRARTGLHAWRVSNWFHQGCVGPVMSPLYAAVKEGAAPTNVITSSFWFNVPSGGPPGLTVSSSLEDGAGLRLTYAAIRDFGAGPNVQVAGVVKGAGFVGIPLPPPFDDPGVEWEVFQSPTLAYDTWYELRVSAILNIGARNDQVTYEVRASNGDVVWSQANMHSWEDAYLSGAFAPTDTIVTLRRLSFRIIENPDSPPTGPREPYGYATNRPLGVYIDDLNVAPGGSSSQIDVGFESQRFVHPDGTDTGSCGTATPASARCRTVKYALDQATPYSFVNVAPGTYDETGLLLIDEPGVQLRGEGTPPTRPILTRSSGPANQAFVHVAAVRDVTVARLEFDMDTTYTAEGILATGFVENLHVDANRFVARQSGGTAGAFGRRNAIAINVDNSLGAAPVDGSTVLVENNIVEGGIYASPALRSGVAMDRGLGVIRNNTIVSRTQDITVRFPTVTINSSSSSVEVSNNVLGGRGAQISSPNAGISSIEFADNVVRAVDDHPGGADAYAAGEGSPADFSLLRLVHNETNTPLVVRKNQFIGHAGAYRGVLVQNWPKAQFIENTFTPKPGATSFTSLVISNKELTTDNPPSAPEALEFTALDNTFNGSGAAGLAGTAVELLNDNDGGAVVDVTVGAPGNENNFSGDLRWFFRLADYSCSTTLATLAPTPGGSGPLCTHLNYAGVSVNMPNTEVRPVTSSVFAANNLFGGNPPSDAYQMQTRTYDRGANPVLGEVDYGLTLATETIVYVDDDFAANTFGDIETFEHDDVAANGATVYVGINGFASLSQALAAVQEGGTVYIAKGNYASGATIAKRVRVIGDGNGPADTVFSSTLTIADSGLDEDNRLELRDLRVEGVNGDGLRITGSQRWVHFKRVASIGNTGDGLHVSTNNGLLPSEQIDLLIEGSRFDGNGYDGDGNFVVLSAGLRFDENASVTGLVITGSTFNDNSAAGLTVNDLGAPCSVATIRNVTVTGSEFNRNNKGFNGNPGNDAGGGIWLKTSAPNGSACPGVAGQSVIESVTIQNSVFHDNGTARVNTFTSGADSRAINANGISVRARPGTILSGVKICNNHFADDPDEAGQQLAGIYVFDDTGASSADYTPVEVCGDNQFENLAYSVSGYEQFASRNTQPIVLVTGPVGSGFEPAPEAINTGFVEIVGEAVPGNYRSIQAAINAAPAGATIRVPSGHYNESLGITKTLTLEGGGVPVTAPRPGKASTSLAKAGPTTLPGVIIDGGGTLATGITIPSGVLGVTVSGFEIRNFTADCITAVGAEGDVDLTIRDNHIHDCGRHGIMVDVGAVVQDVTIERNEVHRVGIGALSPPGRGIVLWDGLKRDITIVDNWVHDIVGGCCGIELQDGRATGVLATGNLVENVRDSGMSFIQLTSGSAIGRRNYIAHNIVTNTGRFGIEIKVPNGTGLETGDGAIVFEANEVTSTVPAADNRDRAGIAVIRNAVSGAVTDITRGVVLIDNEVNGFTNANAGYEGYGIVVEGVQMHVRGSVFADNDINFQIQQANSGDQGTPGSAWFGRGNAPVTCVDYDVAPVFVPDGAAMDTVVVNTSNGQHFCSLQSAVDDDLTLDGHALSLDARDFVERVLVDKSLTIAGAGNLVPGGTRLRAPADSGAGGVAVVTVRAPDVTIQDLRIDVDFDHVAQGIRAEASAAPAFTSNGLVVDDVRLVSSATGNCLNPDSVDCAYGYGFRNAILINPAAAPDTYGAGPVPFAATVTNSTIDADAPAHRFRAGIDARNAGLVAQSNNIVSINHDVFSIAHPAGQSVTISGNTFRGFGVSYYAPTGIAPASISGNTFTAAADLANNESPIPAGDFSAMRLIHNNVGQAVLVQGNSFTGYERGVLIENFPGVTLDDNEFTPLAGSNTFQHVRLSNKELFSGSAPMPIPGSLTLTATGNTFSGAGGTAVYLLNDNARLDPDANHYGAIAFSNNTFAGTLGYYFELSPLTCADSSDDCEPLTSPYEETSSSMAGTPVAPFGGNVDATVGNTFGGVLPSSMEAAEIADTQARTYHNDPDAPETPAAPDALGRVFYGFTVAEIPTTTTVISSSPNPSQQGESVTVTAMVTNALNGVPAGTITVTAGDSAGCNFDYPAFDSCELTFTAGGFKTILASFEPAAGSPNAPSSGSIAHAVAFESGDSVTVNDCATPTACADQAETLPLGATCDAPDFSSIQAAIDSVLVPAGAVIRVCPGLYAEDVNLSKPELVLLGAQAGVDARTRDAAAESIVVPATVLPGPNAVVRVTAADVTIDGVTVDANDDDVRIHGIAADSVGGLTLVNTILRDGDGSGFLGVNPAATPVLTGTIVANNRVTNFAQRGIYAANSNYYLRAVNNLVEQVRIGIQTNHNFLPAGSFAPEISGNDIHAADIGIFHNLHQGASPTPWTISLNTIATSANPTTTAPAWADSAWGPIWIGMLVESIQDGASVVISNNTIDGDGLGGIQHRSGYVLNNITAAQASSLAVAGGSVSNVEIGVLATDADYYLGRVDDFVVSGVTFAGIVDSAIHVEDTDAAGSAKVTLGAANTFDPNAFAVTLAGPDAQLDSDSQTVDSVRVRSGGAWVRGALNDSGNNPHGTTAATVNLGIAAANGGTGTVSLEAGDFAQNVVVNKSIRLVGPNEGIAYDGTRSAEATLNPATGIALRILANDVTVDGIAIDDVNDTAIASGLNYGGNTANVSVLNNRVTQVNGSGLYTNGPVGTVSNWTIRGNLFRNLTGSDSSAINLWKATGGLIEGNRVEGAAFGGIQLVQSSNVDVLGNTVIDTANNGIQVTQGTVVVVKDNRVTDANTSADADEGGISVGLGSDDITIACNLIDGIGTNGISTTNASLTPAPASTRVRVFHNTVLTAVDLYNGYTTPFAFGSNWYGLAPAVPVPGHTSVAPRIADALASDPTNGGAFDVGGCGNNAPVAHVLLGVTPQTTDINQPFEWPLRTRLQDVLGGAVVGEEIQFEVPDAGASAVVTPSSTVTDYNGVAEATAVANSFAGGPYAVVADPTTEDLANVVFNLTNGSVDQVEFDLNGPVGGVEVGDEVLYTGRIYNPRTDINENVRIDVVIQAGTPLDPADVPGFCLVNPLDPAQCLPLALNDDGDTLSLVFDDGDTTPGFPIEGAPYDVAPGFTHQFRVVFDRAEVFVSTATMVGVVTGTVYGADTIATEVIAPHAGVSIDLTGPIAGVERDVPAEYLVTVRNTEAELRDETVIELAISLPAGASIDDVDVESDVGTGYEFAGKSQDLPTDPVIVLLRPAFQVGDGSLTPYELETQVRITYGVPGEYGLATTLLDATGVDLDGVDPYAGAQMTTTVVESVPDVDVSLGGTFDATDGTTPLVAQVAVPFVVRGDLVNTGVAVADPVRAAFTLGADFGDLDASAVQARYVLLPGGASCPAATTGAAYPESVTFADAGNTLTAATVPQTLVAGLELTLCVRFESSRAGLFSLGLVIEDAAGDTDGTVQYAADNLQFPVGKGAGTVVFDSTSPAPYGFAHSITATIDESGESCVISGAPAPNAPAGDYTVTAICNGVDYTATGTTTYTVVPAEVTALAFGNLSHVYDGTPKAASATTTPAGVAVNLAYAPVAAPTAAGSYTVTATLADPNYVFAPGVDLQATLVIAKATGTVAFAPLSAPFGTVHVVTATIAEEPATSCVVTGVPAPGDAVGNYTVNASCDGINYAAAGSATYVVTQGTVDIELDGSLIRAFSGTPQVVTATTTPAGVSYTVSYEGLAPTVYPVTTVAPSAAGSYAVTATTTDANYAPATATGTLTITNGRALVLAGDSVGAVSVAGDPVYSYSSGTTDNGGSSPSENVIGRMLISRVGGIALGDLAIDYRAATQESVACVPASPGYWCPLPLVAAGADLAASFGPSTGFPMLNVSSEFRTRYAAGGRYTVDAWIEGVDTQAIYAQDSFSVDVAELVLDQTPAAAAGVVGVALPGSSRLANIGTAGLDAGTFPVAHAAAPAPNDANVIGRFTISHAAALAPADVLVEYLDGGTWSAIPLASCGDDLCGSFGPPSTGFPAVAGYDATTLFRTTFLGATGTYAIDTRIVGIDAAGSETGVVYASSSQSVNIGTGAAATIALVSGNNQQTTVATAFDEDLVVEVRDVGGNLVEGAAVAFNAGVGSDGASSSSGVQGTTAGLAGFRPTANTIAGSYAVRASIANGQFVDFSLGNLADFAPGQVQIAIVSGDDQSARVDTDYALPLQVRVSDRFGNALAGRTVAFEAPASGSSIEFAGSGSEAFAVMTDAAGIAGSGIVSANSIAGDVPVGASVDAAECDIGGSAICTVGFSLLNTEEAPSSVTLEIVAPADAQATVGEAGAYPLRARVLDQFDNPVPGVSVTFVAPSSGASLTPTPVAVLTDASGYAVYTFSANTVAGTFEVEAIVSGAANDPAERRASLTNVAAEASKLVAVSGSPQSAPVNTTFGMPLQLRVTDAFDNPVSGATVEFTSPSGGASANVPSLSISDADGLVSVTATANAVAGGPYLVTASASGFVSANTVDFSLTNTAAAPASVQLSVVGADEAIVGTPAAYALQAEVRDGDGNVVPGVSVTFVVEPDLASGAGATSASVIANTVAGIANAGFGANTNAGPFTVRAVVSGVVADADDAVTLTNLPAAAASIEYVSGDAQTTAVGTAFAPLRVRVVDAFGNAVADDAAADVAFDVTPVGGAGATVDSPVASGAGGIASAAATANATAGSYTVSASFGPSTVVFNLRNAAQSITITDIRWSDTGTAGTTYDAAPKSAAYTTLPTADITCEVLYNGEPGPVVDAGTYLVDIDCEDGAGGLFGSASATLVIAKADSGITLSGGSFVYDGLPQPATVLNPNGAVFQLSYTGTGATTYGPSSTPPTAAGSYEASLVVVDANYEEPAPLTAAIEITPAPVTLTFGNLSQVYDGTPKSVSVSTTPAGVAGLSLAYTPVDPPVDAGSYTVTATLSNPNYALSGPNTANLTITQASAQIFVSNLTQIFDGTPKPVLVSTVPASLAGSVVVTYDGDAMAPSAVGNYAVLASLSGQQNYADASVNATLSIVAAAISQFVIDSPTPVSGTAGAALPAGSLPTVRVLDTNGNGVAGVSILFELGADSGNATGLNATTGADGRAMVGSWTLDRDAGVDTMTARVNGLAGLPTHTFTANSVELAGVSLTKTSESTQAQALDAITYTIEVAHAEGPSNATAVDILDALPAGLDVANATWLCAGTTNDEGQTASCDVANGTGDVDVTAFIPVDTQVTITLTATVEAGTPLGPLVNEASAVLTSSTDPDTSDNDDEHTVQIVSLPSGPCSVFCDGFEGETLRLPGKADVAALGQGELVRVQVPAKLAGSRPSKLFEAVDSRGLGVAVVDGLQVGGSKWFRLRYRDAGGAERFGAWTPVTTSLLGLDWALDVDGIVIGAGAAAEAKALIAPGQPLPHMLRSRYPATVE